MDDQRSSLASAKTNFFIQTIYLLCIIFCLTSCMVGPDFETPESPDVDAYTENKLPEETIAVAGVHGGAKQEFEVGEDIPAQWWELFHSPELNALIEHGIANSPNLKAAEATLREAEDNLIALVGSTMLPTVTGSFTDQRIQFPPFGTTSGITTPSTNPISSIFTTAPPPFNLYNASVNVSYTLDVFGGNRRAIESLIAQVDYQRYELEAAYLTLTANIVTTAITEASYREQIVATNNIIAAEAKELDITKKQFKLGGIAKTGVLAQETQLEQTRATLPPLEKNLAQARVALAVLIGEFPGNTKLPVFHLKDLHLPTELPVSIPSALVRQRPDIQAAEALLHAATAEIGVTTANLLPNFTLTGAYGTETSQFQSLFGPGTNLWNWQAQVLQTLFSGGSLLAKREASIEAFKVACAQYQEAVLLGFQNVADTLIALESDAKTLEATKAAENAAKENLDLVQGQFFLGGTNYLNLLYAQMQYHQAYLSRVQAEATRYADTAALFQAMGGGWWNRKNEVSEVTDDAEDLSENVANILLIDSE